MNSKARSAAKAITWRFTASLMTLALFFVITGELFLSLGASAIEVVAKLVTYYIHERVWENIKLV